VGCVFNRGRRHQPRWYVKYRDVDGRWKMVPSRQPTKKKAQQYVAEIEGRVANGKLGIPEPSPEEVKRDRLTVKELAALFLRDYTSPRLKDPARYRKAVGFTLHHLTGSLGYMRVTDVGRLHLSRLRDEKLAAGLSKATVKLVLAYTSRMWNWARAEGLIDGLNPVALVDKPSVAGQAMDFNVLSMDEADCLLSWAREKQPKEYPAYATALYTGLRMGELWGLRWADCDLERGLLTVRRSYRLAPKSGKPRAVPINPALLPMLRQWRNDCPASDEALVFPTARGYMRQKDRDYGFKAALAGAECHPVTFHGLRHTFASHFMMSGGNILTLQKLLGHSSVAVTMKYAHLAPDFMRDEIARLRFERPTAAVTDLAEHHANAR